MASGILNFCFLFSRFQLSEKPGGFSGDHIPQRGVALPRLVVNAVAFPQILNADDRFGHDQASKLAGAGLRQAVVLPKGMV